MFRITGHKGFQMKFANGCTVSVQFGPGNYCEHHLNMNFDAPRRADGAWESEQAEVAAFDTQGRWHDFGNDEVRGHLTADEVMDFMREIQERGVKPKFSPPGSRAESVMYWRPGEES